MSRKRRRQQQQQEKNNDNNNDQQCNNEYKIIEVAIAYDCTFCQVNGNGNKDIANEHVVDIISGASLLYESQGICTKLVLSHIEGYCGRCQHNNDPYKDIITSNNNNNNIGCDNSDDSMVERLKIFLDNNRKSIHRDTFHLL